MSPHECQGRSALPRWVLEQDPTGSAVSFSFWSTDEVAHEVSSRCELMKHRDPERLQMAAAMEVKALKEQREAQARQRKEAEAEKVSKFAGAEPGESLKIILTWILGLMGLCRW